MRNIRLTRLEARFLRENLIRNQEGYDYTDLVRLDTLAKRLTDLQGDYAEQMAELARTEKQIRRAAARQQITPADRDTKLTLLTFAVEDLNEVAADVPVEFRVEDGDWRLIKSKLDAVASWLATDEVRPTVLGMIKAVMEAETDAAEPPEPKRLKAIKG